MGLSSAAVVGAGESVPWARGGGGATAAAGAAGASAAGLAAPLKLIPPYSDMLAAVRGRRCGRGPSGPPPPATSSPSSSHLGSLSTARTPKPSDRNAAGCCTLRARPDRARPLRFLAQLQSRRRPHHFVSVPSRARLETHTLVRCYATSARARARSFEVCGTRGPFRLEQARSNKLTLPP